MLLLNFFRVEFQSRDPCILASFFLCPSIFSSVASSSPRYSKQKRRRSSAPMSASSSGGVGSDECRDNGGRKSPISSSSFSFSSNSSTVRRLPRSMWNVTPNARGVEGQQQHSSSLQSAVFAGLPLNSPFDAHSEQSTTLPLTPPLNAFSPSFHNNADAPADNAADGSTSFRWSTHRLEWAASSRDRVISLAQYLLNTTPFIGTLRIMLIQT